MAQAYAGHLEPHALLGQPLSTANVGHSDAYPVCN